MSIRELKSLILYIFVNNLNFIIMKKLLLIGLIALSAISFTQVETNQNDNVDCKYGQCLKIKSDGYQCKNCAQEGSSYCWSHKPKY